MVEMIAFILVLLILLYCISIAFAYQLGIEAGEKEKDK